MSLSVRKLWLRLLREPRPRPARLLRYLISGRVVVVPERAGYQESWDAVSQRIEDAYSMMDGSPDEETLQANGRKVADKLRRALLITKEDKVLEIGCGVARIGKELAPFCGEWHGVDVSPSMIKIARERTQHLENVMLRVVEGCSLKHYGDNYFDKVYSHIVFFHLDKEDVFTYLEEIYRVLRPRGLAYYDTWNLMNDLGWERFLFERDHYEGISPRPTIRNQFATPEEMLLYTEKAGLQVVNCLDETFWIQVIATKSGPQAVQEEADALVTAKREELERNSSWEILTPRSKWNW